MNFDLEYIEKLLKLLSESNVAEVILQDGEQLIELRKPTEVAVAGAPMIPAYSTSQIVSAPTTPVAAEAAPAAKADAPKGKPVTSPMVGTFYAAASPTAKPFVAIGDTVSTGQVVCIIEAMKLMNEIEAEVSGKVIEICVQNGQPVEYGQVLMYVE